MNTTFYPRNLRYFFVAILLVAITSYNCSNQDVTLKHFECENDNGCKKSHVCQEGKCVLADDDGDGWAKSKEGWASNKDCNDNNKDIYPGAPEICDNQADDNCDGRIDEQPCQCQNGKVRECGQDKGICKKGTQTCNAGVWGTCEGAINPKPEECNGKDDDCDGSIDEGVPDCCQPEETRPCGFDVGECKQGIQKCDVGKWTECSGSVGPQKEECNGKDDDCDGKIDNLRETDKPIQQPCYRGTPDTNKKGACKEGFQVCKDGKWDTCQNDVLPEDEVCDNKDNDCDGQIDNIKGEDKILQRECYSADPNTKNKGVCKAGLQRCVGGQWSTCLGEIAPISETCNGIDDDCDGTIDNTPNTTKPLNQACYSGAPDTRQKGICTDGLQECVNGRWTSCQSDKLPEKEECNGKDDDCDGRSDNINGKPDPLTEPCYTGTKETQGKGECKDGTRTCQNGQWAACQGDTLPANETCNGKDDDCNGKIDDGLPSLGACQTTQPGECKAGTLQCVNGAPTCVATHKIIAETCNNKDDDCNGKIDDNLTQPCGTDTGECKKGTQTCTNGQWGTCVGEIKSVTETCDNRDNDCDGQVDENLTRTCGSAKGECRTGIETCTNGQWGTCIGEVKPKTETCNGLDDDCNGIVDDGNPGGGGTCAYSGKPGLCSAGRLECRSGAIQCIQIVFPVNEACRIANKITSTSTTSLGQAQEPAPTGKSGSYLINDPNGRDDDCNGVIDNDAPCSRGYACSGGSCQVCSQPSSRCSNYDLFCTSNAPSINCNCGFTSYCYQQSSSVFCSGCCAERRCH